ncbi:MAG: hypothetical protein M1827_005005 [Pycnora praestabilis]|nr:MAG: hypothetical protein M1827_005005 [Pycnora praestabilis]
MSYTPHTVTLGAFTIGVTSSRQRGILPIEDVVLHDNYNGIDCTIFVHPGEDYAFKITVNRPLLAGKDFDATLLINKHPIGTIHQLKASTMMAAESGTDWWYIYVPDGAYEEADLVIGHHPVYPNTNIAACYQVDLAEVQTHAPRLWQCLSTLGPGRGGAGGLDLDPSAVGAGAARALWECGPGEGEVGGVRRGEAVMWDTVPVVGGEKFVFRWFLKFLEKEEWEEWESEEEDDDDDDDDDGDAEIEDVSWLDPALRGL